MIDAVDVQGLYTDATTKGETQIAALALEALEHGIDCEAWERCALILAVDGALVRRRVGRRVHKADMPIPYRLAASAT